MSSDRAHLDWMQTFTGKAFFPLEPKEGAIELWDIAYALGRCCRFAGHTSRFYSVAEHSVHVSYECKPEHALEGLFHHAAEAYLGDLTRPVKLALRFIEGARSGQIQARSSYDELEDAICRKIAAKWKLQYPWPDDIKAADQRVLMLERSVLMPSPPHAYRESGPAAHRALALWDHGDAASGFLRRFSELSALRNF